MKWRKGGAVPFFRPYPLSRKPFAGGKVLGYTPAQLESRGTLIEKISVGEHTPMEWVTPQHESVDLYCEVSSYANAEL